MKTTRKGNRLVLRMSKAEWNALGKHAGNDLGGAVDIKKYGRYWAVFIGAELLAVVVYLKGAESIKRVIEVLMQNPIPGAD